VRALIDADRRGALDAAYPILVLCCVELWCRRFIDGGDRSVGDLPGRAHFSP
jgi:hypothetical protein